MRKSKLIFSTGLMIISIIILTGWNEQAQSQEAYPTKPIEIIIPFAAGGGADLTNRILADALRKKWGVPVNVINKPGGNSIPAMLAVHNANPDGYTVLGDGNSTSTCRIVEEKDLPFKIMDRTYVSMVATNPMLILVAINSPSKHLKDEVAEAKRDPKNFAWALTGAGTDSSGMVCRQFFKAIDVDMSKTRGISSQGGSQVMTLVAGGNARMTCMTMGSSSSQLKAGTVKALAATSKNRHPDLPDVPTTAESGYPNVDIIDWKGITGPPKLPAFIVARWEKALEEILRDPEVIAKLGNMGMTPAFLDSKTFREYVVKEADDISKLFR